MNLSALMSVYHKESPAFLRQSLDSLCSQTLPADEVVIVEDGTLGAKLDAVIDEYCRKLPIVSLQLPENVGLGVALRIGVENCRGKLIARMDSDDICVPRRFELQRDAFAQYHSVDVVGGAIAEFMHDPGKPISVRRLPKSSDDIAHYAEWRNPLNHMTVMFRREAVLKAGNYQPFSGFEDYYLWARMLKDGSRFVNLDDVLVRVRVGNGMLARRSGLKYLRTEIEFQRSLCNTGFISARQAILNSILRAPVRLAPQHLRQVVYRKFLRSS